MNFITDYQLDIDKGFMCKVNGIAYQFDFKYSTRKYLYYVSNILKLADHLEIDRSELKGIFNNETAYDVIYCNSKQQCYDLCQIIVQLYFRPKQTGHERLVPDVNFIYNDKLYQFTLKILNGKYVWQNVNDICTHIFIKTHPDLPNIKKELNINISISGHSEYLGFDTKEDAIKFVKYVIKYYYSRTDKKESCEKFRRYLAKYYYNDQYGINLPERSFSLRRFKEDLWYWHNNNLKVPSNCIYSQFKLSKDQALEICNKLNLKCILHTTVPTFENPNDAIKFTDYLIETYIIKKEKTYDTNQLRKERTAISRGAKPAGSIIHGRRSKASIRRGCIKHQTCFGY
jgi:hypothetical protein